MDTVIKSGRYLFSFSFIIFGFQHLIFATTRGSLSVGNPWVTGRPLVAALVGGVLIVAGVGLMLGRKISSSAALFGLLLLAYALFVYVPRLMANVRQPQPWTQISELLAMSAVAFILAGCQQGSVPALSAKAQARLVMAGRILFGIQLAIWGIQHIMYATFVANLVPVWLPWRFFWGVFVGGAFIAAGVSFASGLLTRLAAMLLAVQFFLIVTTLHIPLVIAEPFSGQQWTSIMVALTMLAGALIVAQSSPAQGSIFGRIAGREAIGAA